MDRRLALVAGMAIPVLALIFFTLTRIMPPLAGYALGLCFYWLFLAVLLWRTTTDAQRRGWLAVRSPGRMVTGLLILPVFGLGMLAMPGLGSADLHGGLLLAIALGAVVNATLEELFWRGAILPRPDAAYAIPAVLGLFTLWHVALLASRGVVMPGGPLMLLAGAGALGAIFMLARLNSGTLGAGIIGHAGVNLFAFLHLAHVNTG